MSSVVVPQLGYDPNGLGKDSPVVVKHCIRVNAIAGTDILWGYLCAVAQELGVLVTGGSDDHGKRTTDGRMRIGTQPVPDDVLERLREQAFRFASRFRVRVTLDKFFEEALRSI